MKPVTCASSWICPRRSAEKAQDLTALDGERDAVHPRPSGQSSFSSRAPESWKRVHWEIGGRLNRKRQNDFKGNFGRGDFI